MDIRKSVDEIVKATEGKNYKNPRSVSLDQGYGKPGESQQPKAETSGEGVARKFGNHCPACMMGQDQDAGQGTHLLNTVEHPDDLVEQPKAEGAGEPFKVGQEVSRKDDDRLIYVVSEVWVPGTRPSFVANDLFYSVSEFTFILHRVNTYGHESRYWMPHSDLQPQPPVVGEPDAMEEQPTSEALDKRSDLMHPSLTQKVESPFAEEAFEWGDERDRVTKRELAGDIVAAVINALPRVWVDSEKQANWNALKVVVEDKLSANNLQLRTAAARDGGSAESLFEQCPLCAGKGTKERPAFTEGAAPVSQSCRHCHGKGRVPIAYDDLLALYQAALEKWSARDAEIASANDALMEAREALGQDDQPFICDAICSLKAEIAGLRRERDVLRIKADVEAAIVDRVWAAIEVKTYADAGGKEISQLVREWKARAEAAEAALLKYQGWMRHLKIEERFWSRVEKTDNCWLWRGVVRSNGYGSFAIGQKHIPAHRFVWEMLKGAPGEMHVCHSCDNPICVNPDHLWLGTRFDNMRDAASKGRNGMQRHPEKSHFGKGEEQTNAKLKEKDVLEIRAAGTAGDAPSEIAKRYGVTVSNIRLILHGKAWRHLLPATTEKENTPSQDQRITTSQEQP